MDRLSPTLPHPDLGRVRRTPGAVPKIAGNRELFQKKIGGCPCQKTLFAFNPMWLPVTATEETSNLACVRIVEIQLLRLGPRQVFAPTTVMKSIPALTSSWFFRKINQSSRVSPLRSTRPRHLETVATGEYHYRFEYLGHFISSDQLARMCDSPERTPSGPKVFQNSILTNEMGSTLSESRFPELV